EAVARFPGRSDFHAARAVALARLGKHTEVRTAVAAADRLTPGPEDCFRVAGALARSADPADQDAALCWLRRAYLAGVRDLTRYDTAQDLTELRSGSSFRNFRTAAAEMGLGATPPGRQNDAAPGTEPGAAR
ncbi:MAG TPA: hypothetical protein VH092_25210, partial [Urbifossiella sp.]|nr:hypothetical protein [Urbifossiella sp.]